MSKYNNIHKCIYNVQMNAMALGTSPIFNVRLSASQKSNRIRCIFVMFKTNFPFEF